MLTIARSRKGWGGGPRASPRVLSGLCSLQWVWLVKGVLWEGAPASTRTGARAARWGQAGRYLGTISPQLGAPFARELARARAPPLEEGAAPEIRRVLAYVVNGALSKPAHGAVEPRSRCRAVEIVVRGATRPLRRILRSSRSCSSPIEGWRSSRCLSRDCEPGRSVDPPQNPVRHQRQGRSQGKPTEDPPSSSHWRNRSSSHWRNRSSSHWMEPELEPLEEPELEPPPGDEHPTVGPMVTQTTTAASAPTQ